MMLSNSLLTALAMAALAVASPHLKDSVSPDRVSAGRDVAGFQQVLVEKAREVELRKREAGLDPSPLSSCYYIRDEGILYYSVLLPDDGNFAQTCGEGIRPALLTLCAEPTKYDCLPGVFVVDGQLYNGITIWVAPECDPPSIHTALYLGTNARVDLQCSQIIF